MDLELGIVLNRNSKFLAWICFYFNFRKGWKVHTLLNIDYANELSETVHVVVETVE